MSYWKIAQVVLPKMLEVRIHRLRKGCLVEEKSQQQTAVGKGASEPAQTAVGKGASEPAQTAVGKGASEPNTNRNQPEPSAPPQVARPLLLSSDLIKTVGLATCGGALVSGWLRFVFGSLAPFPT